MYMVPFYGPPIISNGSVLVDPYSMYESVKQVSELDYVDRTHHHGYTDIA